MIRPFLRIWLIFLSSCSIIYAFELPTETPVAVPPQIPVATPAPVATPVPTVEPIPVTVPGVAAPTTATIPAATPVAPVEVPVAVEAPAPAPTPTPVPIPTQTAEAPAPVQPVATVPTEPTQQTAAEEKKETEKIGIDTVDIEEGGNWLLKRKALEDTIDIIEQINRLFTKILESRMDYKIKRNQLDSEYDLFVASIGFDLGDVDELLSNISEMLEVERKKQGDLAISERDLAEEINQKKKEIEQLKEDLKSLHDLEMKINDVLMTVENQINVASEHQNQAWKNFQLIKKILSDEKAEELYYNTEGLLKSLQEIYSYLTIKLPQYYNDQLQAMRNQMAKIKDTVKSLKDKGIDLKNEFEKLEAADREREQKRFKEEEQAEIKQGIKKAEEEKAQKTLWHSLISWIKSFFAAIVKPFNYLAEYIKSLFVKTSSETTIPMPQPTISTEPITPTSAG